VDGAFLRVNNLQHHYRRSFIDYGAMRSDRIIPCDFIYSIGIQAMPRSRPSNPRALNLFEDPHRCIAKSHLTPLIAYGRAILSAVVTAESGWMIRNED